MSEPESPRFDPGDNPIDGQTGDRLDRAEFATRFANDVLSLDATRGMVVAVTGPWGSGKTSFLNMCRETWESAEAPVLDFNPWMFSGADQLVASFFAEVSSQLKERRPKFASIADGLADYGDAFSGLAWLPVVGTWLERARLLSRGAATIAGRSGGTAARRADLTNRLTSLSSPIIVALDDIDRLSTDEIRDMFRLVRLTASFPNIVYVLAFDAPRVEDALGENGIPGAHYLEKIIQVSYDLPVVGEQHLHRELFAELDRATSDAEVLPLDEEVWPDIFMELVAPVVRNMRDVRRLGLALRGSAQTVGTDVALADFLALEAIRVLAPGVFRRLTAAATALTSNRESFGSGQRDALLKAEIDRLSGSVDSERALVQSLIQRLFPVALRHIGGSRYGDDFLNGWLRKRRVAHADVLGTYLAKRPTEGLETFRRAELAFSLLGDRHELDAFLRGLPIDEVDSVIESLEAWEREYPNDAVVPALTVLLNLLPDLPERHRGMFDFGTRVRVGRVIYRLIRSLEDPNRVLAAVREVLPEVSSLSSRLDLITDVGWKENAGHKLVSEADAAELETELFAQVRKATPESLAREWDLLRLVYNAMAPRTDDNDGPAYAIPTDPVLTLGILRAATSSNRGQTVGSRAIRETRVLHWEMLTQIFGSETQLATAIAAARPLREDEDESLFALVDRYLEGWRPKTTSFDDTDE
jgi:hypothetical protein